MKTLSGKFRRAFLIAGAAAIPFISLGGTEIARGADQLHIAMNMPLTGPIADAIIPFRNAFLMGLDAGAKEFNVPRDALVTDIQDNAGEPAQAVSIMQKQFLNPVDVYVSSANAQTAAIVDQVDKKNVPHFMFAFEAFLARGHENRVRTTPHFKVAAPLYVQWVQARHAKRVAFVFLNWSSFQQMFGEIVIPELKKAGVDVMIQAFDMGTKDYSTLALKVADYKPDAIIVDGFAFHMVPLIGALRTLDLIHDGNTFLGVDFMELLYSKTPGADVKGITYLSTQLGLPEGVKHAAAWTEQYQTTYKMAPGAYGAYGYDTARIIVEAYAKSHKVTVATIRSVLPFDGVAGKINLDKDNDLDGTMGIGHVTESGTLEAFK